MRGFTKIRVLRRDINEGVPTESDACPVKIAINRTVDDVIAVGSNDFTIGGTYMTCVELDLPPVARDFVRRFDWEGRSAVKPFSFWLPIS